MTDATSVRRLKDFEGVWNVERKITPKSGPAATFKGQAVWTPEKDGLAYKEQGLMTLEGHAPMQAERRYFWSADLSVFFDDGRYFHQVPAEGGEAHHWCDPDSYAITYDFAPWPEFRVLWHVTGPRKDYRAVTRYSQP